MVRPKIENQRLTRSALAMRIRIRKMTLISDYHKEEMIMIMIMKRKTSRGGIMASGRGGGVGAPRGTVAHGATSRGQAVHRSKRRLPSLRWACLDRYGISIKIRIPAGAASAATTSSRPLVRPRQTRISNKLSQAKRSCNHKDLMQEFYLVCRRGRLHRVLVKEIGGGQPQLPESLKEAGLRRRCSTAKTRRQLR